MNIRPATVDDALNLSILFKIVWIETYAIGSREISFSEYVSKYFSKESVLDLLSRRSVLIAELDSKLVGGGVIHTETGELETTYILPIYRSKGFGQALMLYLDTHAAHPLWLTCPEKDKRSLRFYKKHGYRAIGESYSKREGKQQKNIKLAKFHANNHEVHTDVS